MAAFTQRCPTELLAAILGSCESLGDVKALILTCRRTHAVWLAHAPFIIAAVAPRAVVAFDAALMAVRATDMVHKAELAAQLPPVIDPRTLSLSSRRPTPSELSAVVDMDRFAEHIQARYCRIFDDSQHAEERYYAPWGRWPADRRRGEGGDGFPEEPEGMPLWTERFRRAIYTALLLGAVLARPYQEPFVAGEARWRESVLKRLGAWRNDLHWDDFTAGEVEYLRGFPVFDFTDEDGGHETAFGDATRWLIESTRERIRSEPLVTECPSRSLSQPRAHWKGVDDDENDDWIGGVIPLRAPLFDEDDLGFAAESEGVVWVVMQTVHIFEFLLESITDDPTMPSLGRDADSDADFPANEAPRTHDASQRTVDVVLLGTFRAETVTLPDEAAGGPLHARLAAPPTPEKQHKFADIPGALAHVYCSGNVPNVLDNFLEIFEAPPPPLQFFTYLLRENFDLQFMPGTFEVVRNTQRQIYRQFKWRASIFANHFDDVPERAWFRREDGIERRLLDVTNGTEILALYRRAVPLAQRIACDPRTFDTFEFFQQLGIYDDDDDDDEEDDDSDD